MPDDKKGGKKAKKGGPWEAVQVGVIFLGGILFVLLKPGFKDAVLLFLFVVAIFILVGWLKKPSEKKRKAAESMISQITGQAEELLRAKYARGGLKGKKNLNAKIDSLRKDIGKAVAKKAKETRIEGIIPFAEVQRIATEIAEEIFVADEQFRSPQQ